MGYAQDILSNSGTLRSKRLRKKQFVDSVPCAYCRGTGIDRKFGNTSRCPVCSGRGQIKVKPPVVTCLRCRGSGREGGDLGCLACRGTGVVSLRKDAATCPRCNGTGEDGVFYCSVCKGQGIV